MAGGFNVCITGHRPEKLPGGARLRMLQSMLYYEIAAAAAEGAQMYYVGMARGTDLWAADVILQLRKRYPQIAMTAVLPFADRARNLSGASLYHINAVLAAADTVVTMGSHFYRGCYRDRNQYMVDHSQRVIAVIADYRSGTGQTIHMAKRAGLELRIIPAEHIPASDDTKA